MTVKTNEKKIEAPIDDTERLRRAHAARMRIHDYDDECIKAAGSSHTCARGTKACDRRHVAFTPQGVEQSVESPSPGVKVITDSSAVEKLTEDAKLSSDNVCGLIVQECRALEQLLLSKNAGYGNSALDPVRMFSKASPVAGILVRIDDKLSRISRGNITAVTDETLVQTVDDLVGYLILLKVAWRLQLS